MRLARAERLSEFLADERTPDILIQRLAMGETLEEICASREVPPSIVAQWIAKQPWLADACVAARNLYGDTKIKLADRIVSEATKPEDVPVAKLKSEWNKWVAGKVNRERWGEKTDVNIAVGVKVEIVRFADEQVVGVSDSPDEPQLTGTTPALEGRADGDSPPPQ